MADSGVPFGLDASNVPLVEDFVDLPFGEAATITVLVSGLESADDVTTATLIAKVNPSDGNATITTISKTITSTLSADGVITETDDPSVRRLTFQLTRENGVRLSRYSTYEYSVVATVDRATVTSSRMIQRGALSVVLFSITFEGPTANGQYFADGVLFANGFDPI